MKLIDLPSEEEEIQSLLWGGREKVKGNRDRQGHRVRASFAGAAAF